ncbi:hypothetical protein ACWGID_37490 [Kribbella sp. NPDC054772]
MEVVVVVVTFGLWPPMRLVAFADAPSLVGSTTTFSSCDVVDRGRGVAEV